MTPETASILFVYIPCGSAEEAQKIGRALVEEKLAACANILQPMQSVYYWQDKLEQLSEVPLVLKTRAALYQKLEARVLALHSYEVPCITALPAAHVNASYAAWIFEQTEAN